MKTKKGRFLPLFLLLLAAVCIALGEAGLSGNADLLEYAAPYGAQAGNGGPLLEALDDLQEQLPDAQLSASVFTADGWVQAATGRFASCAITGVAPGWFELYPHRLLAGRYFGEAEMLAGERVALVSTELADALWGDIHAVGKELLLNGTPFRIIGILDEAKAWGASRHSMLYLPLQAAFQVYMQPDIQILSCLNGRENPFEHIGRRYFPDGSFYNHERERMRAGLSLRYLCVAALIFGLKHTLCRLHDFSKASIRKWQERYTHVYASHMLIPTMLLGIQHLMTYGLWASAAYAALQLAAAPASVFSEWIPEDLSSLSSYVAAFARAADECAELRITLTDPVLRIRRCGTFIHMGSILVLAAIALPHKAAS